ncbi:MAG: hypothetical protein HOV81_11025 [Kofleriaceae bacterium]|nr:hypothetical protein [Kofleriaceae bacterium]
MTPHSTAGTTAVETIAPTALPPPPVPTPHKLRELAFAPHAGAIVELAATPDGGAVVTTDELGGARLWLSLDGKHEPAVLSLPEAEQLAIGRTADGLWIVARDQVGGLYIVKLDAKGRALSHVTVGPEPAIVGMVMTERGLLAWRADQTVVLVDADGAITARIPTEPHERVVAIGTAGKRAIALMEWGDGSHGVRWLGLDTTLAWGKPVKLQLDLTAPSEIALSPSGARIAVLSQDQSTVAVKAYDLASGKTLATGATNSATGELGFIDDNVIAVGSLEGISWLDLSAATPTLSEVVRATSPFARSGPVLAATKGRALTSTGGELALTTPSATEFLGYELVSPRFAEVAPNGQILVGVGETFSLLDAQLESVSSPALALPTGSAISQLEWLGGDDWLVETLKSGTTQWQLAVVDLAKNTSTLVRPDLKETHILAYEPATKLATLSFGSTSEVVRYDARTRAFDRVASVAKPSPYEQVLFVPTAPKLAGGTQLLHIQMRDRPTIKWLRDPAALDKPSATVTIEGSYAGSDAAGHVFLWRSTAGKLELAAYGVDGKPISTLPADGPVSLWPDATGSRIVEVGAHSIGLYRLDGTQVWLQNLASAQQALWLTDGSLAITSASGIARLDPATGAVVSARCGWRFGLSRSPHPPTPRLEPLCSQLAR